MTTKPLEEAGGMKLSAEFGALAPSLSQQPIAKYIHQEDLARFERIADAITVVTLHGYLAPKQSDRARDKLFKEIVRAVNKQAKP